MNEWVNEGICKVSPAWNFPLPPFLHCVLCCLVSASILLLALLVSPSEILMLNYSLHSIFPFLETEKISFTTFRAFVNEEREWRQEKTAIRFTYRRGAKNHWKCRVSKWTLNEKAWRWQQHLELMEGIIAMIIHRQSRERGSVADGRSACVARSSIWFGVIECVCALRGQNVPKPEDRGCSSREPENRRLHLHFVVDYCCTHRIWSRSPLLFVSSSLVPIVPFFPSRHLFKSLFVSPQPTASHHRQTDSRHTWRKEPLLLLRWFCFFDSRTGGGKTRGRFQTSSIDSHLRN